MTMPKDHSQGAPTLDFGGVVPAHDTLAGEPPIVLATHGLTKSFGGKLAVDHLDLTVRRGDVFGFLGPNGAGKTTTIRMIVGLIYPTSGYATVIDHQVPRDKKEALKHIGGFVEVPAFYGNMSARRNLRLMGGLNGSVDEARISEVLDVVGLRERADSKVGDYSHGMKQRLGIANALINAPELVILDEPTSGLDPQGMKDVRELVRELGDRGTTVFLSSHLLHEVEQVCNRAAILNRGRVVDRRSGERVAPGALRGEAAHFRPGQGARRGGRPGGRPACRGRRGVSHRGIQRRHHSRDGRSAGRGGRRRRRRHPGARTGSRRLLPGAHAELRCRYRRGGRRLGRCEMMLLRREFTKLIHQKRSYVGWGGLLAVPLLVTLALYLNRNNHHHDNGPGGVISLAMHNGLLMPVAAIILLSAFLLPLLASMVGAYQLAGEAETGTIKTWLMHSISRGGVLASKWGIAIIYVIIGLVLVFVGGLIGGALAFGLHAPALLSGQTVSVEPRPVADAACRSSTCWSA